MTAMSPATHHPLRGFALFCFALLLFACMDTTIKYLSQTYPVPMIVGIRYIVHCLLMVVLLAPRQGRKLIATKRTGLVAARGVALAIGSLFAGLAFSRLPVAEATSILFLSPVIVVLAAGPLLGERVKAHDWVALVLGFVGVLLIAQPGAGMDPVGVAFALAAACTTSTYQLLSRVLVSTERVMAMLFYTALIGAIIFGLALPFVIGGPKPTPVQVLLFLFTGAAGGVGHYLFTAAYREAPASMLAPMLYLQLIWAALMGWLVFDHVPHGIALAGMAVVACAGILVATARRAPPEPAEP